ncbi:kinase-like domain-containing protein [Plectosphaerella cucumerina]|uniref:EKC/KEOPS complex subunit BUD32 n=1 Tax=Plectosphaerella cucumerina TaxID=40658 RepID=A0A8K0X3I9_9PEZI|nr:kinase-like domain-containing protein [Plectosphaerella cucumerina]
MGEARCDRVRMLEALVVGAEWERELHPKWPESAFRIPDAIPDGFIYFITRGEYIGSGSTALVERLPSGHIVKTPLVNPYDSWQEKKNRKNMDREHQVYLQLGSIPFVPKLIDWEDESKALTLEYLPRGDLLTFLKAQALTSLHSVGVIHQDVTPRNFLLTEDLDLRICDFAGSSYPGNTAFTGSPGPRYQSKIWRRGYCPTQADNVFSLGSVLYFIMTAEEPFSNLDDEEVESRFGDLNFPETDGLSCGAVIQDCWRGRLSTAEQVVAALV